MKKIDEEGQRLVMLGDFKKLVEVGYCRVSSKYRMIGRVPAGKTAIEALREESPYYANVVDGWLQNVENMAKSQYIRCVGPHLELTQEEFEAFKKAGGQCP